MPLIPLSQTIAVADCQQVQLVATDMDGTLTTAGKFTPGLLQSLEQLATAGLSVLVVTGRSAGWVNAIASYFPVWGAIAENGGLVYVDGAAPTLLSEILDIAQHRQQLATVFQRLRETFPNLQESDDNRFRLTDWTFDVQGLAQGEIEQMASLCADWGWGFTYSTVQCHLKLRSQDKATGLRTVLSKHFPDYTTAQILTVGDSPNDESLFDANLFPLSVGVANVLHYRDRLAHKPAYVTAALEGAGFNELAQLLVNARQRILSPLQSHNRE